MTPDPRDGDPLRPPDPEPAPVDPIRHWIPSAAENPGCGTLLAIIGCVVLAILVAAPTAPAAPSEGPDASVTVKGYADVPVLRGASLTPPSLPAVAARSQPSRARESAPVTLSGATLTGTASWYPARGMIAAMPWYRWGMEPVRATVCSEESCIRVWVSDFCQCLIDTNRERLIDLSDDAFRRLAPLSRGLVRVTVEWPPRTDVDLRMMLEVRDDEVYR